MNTAPPVTGEIEARLREILTAECAKKGFGYASACLRDPEHFGDSHWVGVALEAMKLAYALDRASGDGVRLTGSKDAKPIELGRWGGLRLTDAGRSYCNPRNSVTD